MRAFVDRMVHGSRSTYVNHRCRCNLCKAASASYSRLRYARDPDKMRLRHRLYRQKYPERVAASVARWEATHPESARDRARQYKFWHPARVRESQQHYAQNHAAHFAAKEALRRARQANAGGTVTAASWQALQDAYGLTGGDVLCAYCSRGTKTPQMDHVVPLARGGHHAADNLVPVCGQCNSRKGTKSLLLWMAEANA